MPLKGHIQALKLESDAKLLAEKAEPDRYLSTLKKMAEQQALRESEARNARAVSLARGKDAIKNHIDKYLSGEQCEAVWLSVPGAPLR